MAYFVVENFGLGIDRRRPQVVGVNGSLWEAINCHLTRGGDVEKRKAFVEWRPLPAETFGMAGASNALHVFGSAAPPTMPGDVTYQQLVHPAGFGNIVSVDDVTIYNGKCYVAATFDDGMTFHFYDGVVVPGFVSGRARPDMGNLAGVLDHLVSIITDTQVTVAKTSPTTITITHNTVNTAFTVTTDVVNNGAASTLTPVRTTAASGGVAEVWTLTIAGTFTAKDRYSVSIAVGSGLATWYGAYEFPAECGTILFTTNSKVYQLAGSILSFSAVGNPMLWDATNDAGAGSINMANHSSGNDELTGIETFQGSTAVFSRRAVQIWTTTEDPDNNAYKQTLKNTGTRSQGSVLSFGDVDVFYLDETGIRSVKARSGTNAGFVSDIGVPIDTYVRDITKNVSEATLRAALSCIEPIDGRFMLFIGDRVLVFSYFPSAKMTGWTSYTTEFTSEALSVLDNRVYIRAGNTIYLYGGDTGEVYDDCEVTVELPFINGGKPGTMKVVSGMDIISQGSWEVTARIDPREGAESLVVDYGTLSGVTVQDGMSAGGVTTPFIAPRLINQQDGPVTLSQVIIHYEPGSEAS